MKKQSMARIRQQALGTKLKLASRKELEGEEKCEPCGFQKRKSGRRLRAVGMLWWIPSHPTLIQLRLSYGNILNISHHQFWYLYLSFSNRIVPVFISQCTWHMALIKTLRAHRGQEHSYIPNHMFIGGHGCLPPPNREHVQQQGVLDPELAKHTCSKEVEFLLSREIGNSVEKRGWAVNKGREGRILIPMWVAHPLLVSFILGNKYSKTPPGNKLICFLFCQINNFVAWKGHKHAPLLTRAT